MDKIFCKNCNGEFYSVEKFCPNCGTSLHNSDSNSDKAPEVSTAPGIHADPVQAGFKEEILEYDDPNICLEYKAQNLYASKHGVIPFRLTNLDERIIRKVILSVESRAFRKGDQPISIERMVNLGREKSTDIRDTDFDITDTDGSYAVKVNGCYFDEKNNAHAFFGSFSLKVIDSNHKKPSIIIEDASVISADVIDIGAVDQIIIRDGAAADLRQMVQGSGKTGSEWIKIKIEDDFEKTMILREHGREKRLPMPATPNVFSAGKPKKAFLNYKDNIESKTIQVYTEDKCLLGKNEEQVDLVTMLLPWNEVNNQKNMKISRRHCRLHVNKNKVIIDDLDSTNGTFLDGKPFTSPSTLHNNQIISLANVFSFRFVEYRKLDDTKEIGRLLNNCNTVRDCANALSSISLDDVKDKAPLDAFVLKRQDGYKDKLEYLFLCGAATLGSSRHSTILVSHDSVSELHARLELYNGQFYIEDLNSSEGTLVNGYPLKPYSPHILGRNALILLGKVKMEFRIP